MISIEEAKAIADLATNGSISASFSKEARSGLIKICNNAGVSSNNIVECPNCHECFDKFNDSVCPNCCQDLDEAIVVGATVALPDPDFEQGQNWNAGATGVVTGIETIDGCDHAIVATPDGRVWCIDVDELG